MNYPSFLHALDVAARLGLTEKEIAHVGPNRAFLHRANPIARATFDRLFAGREVAVYEEDYSDRLEVVEDGVTFTLMLYGSDRIRNHAVTPKQYTITLPAPDTTADAGGAA